jgi:hypothetical protein
VVMQGHGPDKPAGNGSPCLGFQHFLTGLARFAGLRRGASPGLARIDCRSPVDARPLWNGPPAEISHHERAVAPPDCDAQAR